ncbi:M48 family metalloprotease [Geminicoccus roseus]|uniref:M48 family metalloprotease n=1 Tax=Geminicoccus roseus TaxID=404900 RepID=UPI00146FAC2F|nr:M48 family metalloprotease [Geminicoccus roseus]
MAVLALVLLLAALPLRAAQALVLLRDVEIETTIRELADPIFLAAGLDPSSIAIYIVNDNTLNAFVAGGQNLFLNSGLLIRTETPDQLAGVIAHEAGHIAGGHLSRARVAMEDAGTQAILGTLLGLAAAVAGAPQVGVAAMAGGLTVAQSGFLKFSRGQEQAADQAAVRYMGELGQSPEGLLQFFEILDSDDLHLSGRANPWLQTHPLTGSRINFLANQVAKSPYAGKAITGAAVERHARMRAKLDAFLSEPSDALRRWQDDPSVPGRYATSIALYRIPRLDDALIAIRALIAEHPDDPYFHELEGQMLYENGRIAEAAGPYREALALLPASGLLKLGLAKTLIGSDDPADLREARQQLVDTTVTEPDNAEAFRLLATAEGRLDNEGAAAIAMAEFSLLVRHYDDARRYAMRATQIIQPGDPDFLKLQDLQAAIDALPPGSRNPRRR